MNTYSTIEFIAGLGTQDQYALGDLSGKLLGRNNMTFLVNGQELSGKYWDTYLPLQGRYSVIHRALVIYKYESRSFF